MLTQLAIRDFVIVDRLELDFNARFGTLTGETGAGKSILIDALALALGERADPGVVRGGCDKAEVSATFDIAQRPEVKAWLEAADLDVSDDLLLRRVIDIGGRSRAYINGSSATVQQLREVGEFLVDIHGQHAHQSLLRADAQRQLVDAYGGLSDLARQVSTLFRAWKDAEATLATATAGGEAIQREREQLVWQVEELGALELREGEWAELEVEHKRLGHAASLIEGVQYTLAALSDGDGACEGQIATVAAKIGDLAAYDPALEEVSRLIQSAQVELEEAVSSLRRYADRVDIDPSRLAEVEGRIDAIHSLSRKFRCRPDELPGLLASWRSRLAELAETADLAALETKVAKAAAAYNQAAAKLTTGRRKSAKELASGVTAIMRQLALASGSFEVALLPMVAGTVHGLELLEFRVSGLAGSEARPLAKVVSGGELSRISLAIQVVTSRSAAVPTLIFDEVDVGIGGGVAEIVGRLLAELGQERQVLCVTHLPQVAARAQWQWQVSKTRQGAAILSRIVPLDAEGRVEEIARMLGGVEITETTRQHARELLALA